MTVIFAFAIAAAVTYLLRSSMMIAGDRFTSSPGVESAIGLVSPAVMTAIVGSALLLDQGRIALPDLASVLAVGGAFVAVRRTGNVGASLAIGLPIYWIVGVVETILDAVA